MSFLFSKNDTIKYGVVIDIGSGSVLGSIVASDPDKNFPQIIWSKREFISLSFNPDLEKGLKNIIAVTLDVFMLLVSKGIASLKEFNNKANISSVQITISAPWSYTVTKTITYDSKEIFTIKADILDKLNEMAEKQIDDELEANRKINNLNLSLLSGQIAAVIANGYNIIPNGKQKTTSLKMVKLNSITRTNLLYDLNEIIEKTLSSKKVEYYSFMTVFYYVVSKFYSDAKDFCLVDVTNEATEIGIVRDGTLQYCTHIPFGVMSLAREFSHILSVPVKEAVDYLIDDNLNISLQSHSEKNKIEIEKVLSSYENNLVKIFKETGDQLAIPKTIFLHSKLDYEELLKKRILIASNIATKANHVVYNVTGELLKKRPLIEKETNETTDSAMLISAQFFHIREHLDIFNNL